MTEKLLTGNVLHQIKLTPRRRQLKMSILSTNVDKKSLETEFLIVICRLTGDK